MSEEYGIKLIAAMAWHKYKYIILAIVAVVLVLVGYLAR